MTYLLMGQDHTALHLEEEYDLFLEDNIDQ